MDPIEAHVTVNSRVLDDDRNIHILINTNAHLDIVEEKLPECNCRTKHEGYHCGTSCPCYDDEDGYCCTYFVPAKHPPFNIAQALYFAVFWNMHLCGYATNCHLVQEIYTRKNRVLGYFVREANYNRA